jgi:tetratricopeptide (TPR) repeat protein
MKYIWSVWLCLALSACSNAAADPDAVTCADANAAADAAVQACTRLLESGKYDASGRVAWLSNRGMHRQKAGRFDEAAEDFSEAISLAPDDARLYLARGATHGMAGQVDQALLDFDRTIELDPKSGFGHMNRATALEKLGRYADSAASYDTAIALVPDQWDAWDGRCWVRAIVGKDLDGALADCERALQLRPDAANTLNTRGFVLFRQGRFKDAIASYNDSIRRDPKVASSYYVRGLARQASGEDGRDDIAKALSLEPAIEQRYAGYGINAAL